MKQLEIVNALLLAGIGFALTVITVLVTAILGWWGFVISASAGFTVMYSAHVHLSKESE